MIGDKATGGAPVWTVSSYSGEDGMGDCVEVSTSPVSQVWVRDTKDRTIGHAAVSAASWGAFLVGIC